jgi:hypothetical protein
MRKRKKCEGKINFPSPSTSSSTSTSNAVIILWIEKLLQTPIECHRKNTVAIVLAPYVANTKM